MKLMGFNFTKINIEKKLDKFENLKINTSMDVSNILKVSSDFIKTNEEILAISFSYSVNYSPEIAKIDLAGNIVLGIDSKLSKEVLKQWKDKKIPEEFKITLFNLILRKSNIKAIQLEEEMNLPYHFQLPSLKLPDKKE